jgi:predicted Zn finger-like uncharacterized protein
MLTVCPKCALTLAVTAADLRIGQGYVRCGRCATVFNALLALSDASSLELPPLRLLPTGEADADSQSATATVTVPASRWPSDSGLPSERAPDPEPAATAELAIPQPAIEDAQIAIDAALAAEPLDIVLEQTAAASATLAPAPEPEHEATPSPAPPVEAAVEIDVFDATEDGTDTPGIEARESPLDATGTVQTIVMQGDSVSQSDEFVDIDTIDSEIAAATRRALEAEARKSIASLDQDLGASGTHEPPPESADVDASPPVETRLSESGSIYVHDRNSLYAPRQPPPKAPPSLLLWGTYAVLLLLILGVQAIHYWRNDLALRNDWIGRSLTHVYAVLGMPLTPHWDLRGYDVRQLGAATNGNGDDAIRVRISLSNRAPRPQPYPVLRLSLYNRYGKRVAARDLQPRDYLPRGKASELMPAALQVDSEVAVKDPGPDASSFELDVCIPAERGLRCASDSPLLPARP